MGTLVWNSPQVGTTTFTARDMDGRFGGNLFEGKTVEINYDNDLIIIHAKMPKGLKGYKKMKLDFIRSFVCAKASFVKGGSPNIGEFMFDTGSDQAVIADSAWAAAHGFADGLKVIKTTTLRDPRGIQYETKTVLAPLLKLNGFALTNVPTMMLAGKNPLGFDVNYFGNGLLKRFNMLLDFKHDYLYLKPNKMKGEGFGGKA